MARNPAVGTHPDLFESEPTAIVRPISEMTDEEIGSLPRTAFGDEEWEELDERLQAEVWKHTPGHQERIDRMVNEFKKRHDWTHEPDENYLAERMGEDLDEQIGSLAGERGGVVEYIRRHGTRNDRAEMQEIFNEYGHGLENEVTQALNEALADNNNWDHDYQNEMGFIRTSYDESFYVDREELDDLLEGMYEEEIEEAIDEINSATYLSLDREDLDKKYGIEIDGYVTHHGSSDPNWERVAAAVKSELGDPEESVIDETLPPEERIVHRFKDGFYVLDLLPAELEAEGKEMRMCVGRPEMGYVRAVREGRTKILSLRTPAGRPKFTIEAHVDKDGTIQGIEQVKGKANRLPGWDLGREGKGDMKVDEVEKVVELMEVLDIDPEEVEDLEPAVKALKGLPPGPSRNPLDEHCGFCRPAS